MRGIGLEFSFIGIASFCALGFTPNPIGMGVRPDEFEPNEVMGAVLR